MVADPQFIAHDDTIRNEGNAVHWLASVVFAGKHHIDELVDRKAPNGVFITADMAEHVSDYLSCIDRSPHAIISQEWSYSFGTDAFQVNGRADMIGTVADILSIDDLKYGYVPVAPDNWTLISHAIGYYLATGFVPYRIVNTIHQPRAPHSDDRIRTFDYTFPQLMEFYERIKRVLTWPSDILQTGEWCYKCPSFLSCPARKIAELNAIEAAHIAYNSDISNDEIAFRLDQIARAKSLLDQSEKSYKEVATHRVAKGEIIENYVVKNDLANRSWKEFVTPDLITVLTGMQATEKPKCISVAEAERRGMPETMLSSLSERKNKGNKLVRISANKNAEKMFGKKG